MAVAIEEVSRREVAAQYKARETNASSVISQGIFGITVSNTKRQRKLSTRGEMSI
jgi:hypothetical protein